MKPHWTVSIAPMMDVSDRHFRFFMRCLTRHTLLYAPMITTGALLHGKHETFLDFSDEEKPVALQLGGDSPGDLARCAMMASNRGYAEVNLNVGCPSDRVQNGNFGACLMAQPERVAECVATMKATVNIPITVKHRIGVDERDRYEDLAHFVETVAAAGCDRFIVHARKALLKGLSPKQNRTVPPLLYDRVYQLKKNFPHLTIIINGGIRSIAEIKEHLSHADGVMIGRMAYENPFELVKIDQEIFGEETAVTTREDIAMLMKMYLDRWVSSGVAPHAITRHMMGLYTGIPGARAWRRQLSNHAIPNSRSLA